MKNTVLLFLLSLPIWVGAQSITGTEAVEYDPGQNRFLITNGSSILQQASGSDDLEFFGDEDADYGMEVINNKLYTVSGGFTQSIKVFDLDTEELLGQTTIPGSEFLNGMASDAAGNRIWVTDFSGGNIYEINVADDNDLQVNTIVSNTVCTPNGITYDEQNNRLCYVCWSGGGVRQVDLSDNSTSELIDTGLSQIDGIDHDEDGNFYISSWSPTRITKLSNDFTVQETITSTGLSQPADISYAIETDTLAIANSGSNSITYLYFGDPVGVEEVSSAFELNIYPNPVDPSSVVSFELKETANCFIQVVEVNGKRGPILLQDTLPRGTHMASFAGYSFDAGTYFLEVNINGQSSVKSFVVR